ncbi:quinone oxidoreductase family protein [Pontibacillus yanchengensis]|uniref:quinone oxidoreductase family protein n=1 Tax=Pontibacillus yanchengensis TaxID=462910 RepID=UPI001F3ACCC7|nr:zinc-binding dehydrogenase [Pontibacillus yanchengensis]
MKAIIQYHFGDADVLSFTETKVPEIKENEVLIKTAYTSVNYADIKKRRGAKGSSNFPLVLGLDVAGTIEEAGDNSSFSVGDRVIAFPTGGSYAEFVNASEQLVFKIPDELTVEQAATMPTVSILSYILLHEIGQVKKMDTIVIHSAAGGVGSMLLQLAKLLGVEKVIATVGSMQKEEYVESLGADVVCTYDTFIEEVLNHSNDLGANVIFDSVAGEITSKSLDCLALYGTLVQFGNSSGKAGIIKTRMFIVAVEILKGLA